MSKFLFLSNFIRAINKTRQERYVKVIRGKGGGEGHLDLCILIFSPLSFYSSDSNNFIAPLLRKNNRPINSQCLHMCTSAYCASIHRTGRGKNCLLKNGLIWKYDEPKKIQLSNRPTEWKTLHCRVTVTRWNHLLVSTSKFPLTYFD